MIIRSSRDEYYYYFFFMSVWYSVSLKKKKKLLTNNITLYKTDGLQLRQSRYLHLVTSLFLRIYLLFFNGIRVGSVDEIVSKWSLAGVVIINTTHHPNSCECCYTPSTEKRFSRIHWICFISNIILLK